jgi:predicted DNA-binding protein (MmcQ/YjbR family)
VNYQQARDYLLDKPEAWEDFPFRLAVAVMKVGDKMFATLSSKDDQASMNLKCDPHEAQILRDIFPAVRPGYHMNKRHWNTVSLDGSVPQGELQRMIDNSYALVVRGMPRKQRQALEIRHGSSALYGETATNR